MNSKKTKKLFDLIKYIIYLLFVLGFLDVVVLRAILGFGYPRHYKEENIYRYPVPYVMFTGKPNAEDHNELGFRGESLKNADQDALKIVFFGGSTGYHGDPTIAEVIETKLSDILKIPVHVSNYSVVSSNHRQHMHALIEYLPGYEPDLVIFYGGYNETIQSAAYDPRPGYPYNYFYRAETSSLGKLLIEHSAIFGLLDMKTGLICGKARLQKIYKPFSIEWKKSIVDNYFETLGLAKTITNTMESKEFIKTRFFAFYQPFQIPEVFNSAHIEIVKRIDTTNYVFNVSCEYDSLPEEVFNDIVHVNQNAKYLMGDAIANIIAREIQ